VKVLGSFILADENDLTVYAELQAQWVANSDAGYAAAFIPTTGHEDEGSIYAQNVAIQRCKEEDTQVPRSLKQPRSY